MTGIAMRQKTTKSLFVSHDFNARNDSKIIKLRMEHGWHGYGLFWALVEMLVDTTDYQLPVDYKSLSFGLQAEEKVLQSVIEDFGLFVVKGKVFYSKTLKQRMKYKETERQKKSEGGQKGNEIRWKNHNQKTEQQKANSREEERLKSVYGDEVEQEIFRNSTTTYEV